MKLKELVLSTKKFRGHIYKSGRVLGLNFRYVPKSNQLYVYAYVQSGTDPSSYYKTLIVFNQIKSSEKSSPSFPMKLDQDDSIFNGRKKRTKESNLTTYYLSQPSFNSNIMVRCNCLSFRHEFHWQDSKYKALLGPKIPYKKVPGSNRPPVNPDNIPGLCKHIIQLVLKLIEVKVIKDRDSSSERYMKQPRLER